MTLEKADCSNPLFKNIRGIDGSQDGKVQDFPGVSERETVLADVLVVLSIIPLDLHDGSLAADASKFSG
jgi:hypothetical protein